MSVPAVVWLIIGLASFAILIALVLGLVRQLKLVTEALARFQGEVQPLLEEMRADAERARERAERLQRSESPFPRRARR